MPITDRDHRDDGNPAVGCLAATFFCVLVYGAIALLVHSCS